MSDQKKHVQIGSLGAPSASLSEATIDSIDFRDILVKQLKLANVDASYLGGGEVHIQAGSLQLALSVNVSLTTPPPLPNPSFGTQSMSIPIPLPNISVDLEGVHVHVSEAITQNVSIAAPKPVPLRIGKSDLQGLSAKDVKLPDEGFTLSGLGIENVSVKDIAVPRLSIDELSLDSLIPEDPLVIPGLELGPVTLPSVSVSSTKARLPKLRAGVKNISLSFPDSLGFGLKLDIDADIVIRNMEVTIQNMKIEGQAQTVVIEELFLPVQLEDITLRNLLLDKLAIPEISV